jgi:flagellar protein FlaG
MNVSSIGPLAPVAHVEPAPPQPLTSDQRAVVQAVKAVNATELFGQDRELAFSIDRNSRRTVVRIVDSKTGEVVRQIPAEDVLQMAEELKGS